MGLAQSAEAFERENQGLWRKDPRPGRPRTQGHSGLSSPPCGVGNQQTPCRTDGLPKTPPRPPPRSVPRGSGLLENLPERSLRDEPSPRCSPGHLALTLPGAPALHTDPQACPGSPPGPSPPALIWFSPSRCPGPETPERPGRTFSPPASLRLDPAPRPPPAEDRGPTGPLRAGDRGGGARRPGAQGAGEDGPGWGAARPELPESGKRTHASAD